ncbi:glycine cleavage system protein GcvH [Candidatus Woesearchaeota archaeon]|nr:glycine cleavage system protein GcvH [Candidatus Woesearchaeota archaeon]
MENPKNLKYSKEHEWIKVEGDIAVVGITDFAQKQLTDIVFVELPEEGKHVTQGKAMAVVESVKSVSDVFAPVSGEVVDINSELVDAPEILNKEPYGKGWIVKVKIENKSELNNLLSTEGYEKFLRETKH